MRKTQLSPTLHSQGFIETFGILGGGRYSTWLGGPAPLTAVYQVHTSFFQMTPTLLSEQLPLQEN